MNRVNRIAVPIMLSIALVAVAGCKKQVAGKAPTAPPAAPAPTAQIRATPNAVAAGDKVVLSWSTTNATNISIDGVGTVSASGNKTITPVSSSNYHLVARGEGGTAEADARVTVAPPPAPARPVANTMSEEQEFRANVQDVFFDYDKSNLRNDAQATLTKDASFLSSHPNEKFLIGGYCDERGSNEYNLALGENRAETVKTALVNAGIAGSRIRVVSFGKEKPFCTDATETCWQENRRGGFALDR